VIYQVDIDTKVSIRSSIISKDPLPLRLPLPRESLIPLHPRYPIPVSRISISPSKRPISLLIFGKPSSYPSSLSPSLKMDSSLNIPEYPVSVNHSMIFPTPPVISSLSKEEKMIDATSISHPNIAPSIAPSLIPLSIK
jgi:hypothetical protein